MLVECETSSRGADTDMAIPLHAAMPPRFYYEQMAKYYTGAEPVGKSCHRRVVKKIRERGTNPTDVIWMFGEGQNQVTHSVLTDKDHRVLEGASFGTFLGEQGFIHGMTGERLECLDTLSIEQWLSRYVGQL